MDSLDDIQRHAVLQLRELVNGADEDVAVSVLSSVEWDVQRAAELIFGTSLSTNTPKPMRMPDVQPFEIDDSHQGELTGPLQYPVPPSYSIFRPVWSILAFPLHVLSSVFRFIFGILRIPLPQFRFTNLNFYRPLRPRASASGGPDRWLRELEEETGAISISRSNLARGTTSSVATDAGQSSLTARTSNTVVHTEDGRKFLPEFTICSYEDMLRRCQREAKIGCVILVSEEHDDVSAFKRTTLTHPTFVKKLYDHNIIVWGGDVRDQEAWSASEKLQATTYPFVAFLALQPRRNPSTSSSRSSTPPSLTILSRHQGKSVPSSGPTSAPTLIEHIERQLLPRVTPFLDRITAAERERARDRHLREEQDRAFQTAARRDKERIETKLAEERAQLEAKRRAEEASRKEAREVLIERQKKIDRMEWRRWTRSSIVQPSSSSSAPTSRPLRIAIRLPTGSRLVHSFSQTATLTSLYAFVDSQFIPPQFNPADDPTSLPDQSGEGENALESHILNLDPAEEYWGFRIALAYPRMEIRWKQGTKLLDVTHLKGGGQVVVETTEGRRLPVQNGNTEEDDDGYRTEDSE